MGGAPAPEDVNLPAPINIFCSSDGILFNDNDLHTLAKLEVRVRSVSMGVS